MVLTLAGGRLASARIVAVNAEIIIRIFYLFNARSLTQSPFRIGLFSSLQISAATRGWFLLVAFAGF